MNYNPIEHSVVKHAFVTHRVPMDKMVGARSFEQPPKIGDLVLAEVLTIGHHKRIEIRAGMMNHIFPGDLIIGAFGNRYATDQFEGYVPREIVNECDLLSVGGVCGHVVSRHPYMHLPTRLGIRGVVCDAEGAPVNSRPFGLETAGRPGGIVLVVGSSMNAGKTTTVGTLTRALRKGGFTVAAAKITGTAAGKDARFFRSCGAKPVLDFIDAGYPSTYMIELDELMSIHRTLVGQLRQSNPDYILVEVADGIFQRETRMLLECAEFRASVEHVFFAANDSLSASCGARCLNEYGLPLRAIAGSFTQSKLAMREAEEVTKVRCLNLEQMMDGSVLDVLGIKRPEPVAEGNGHLAELASRLGDNSIIHNGNNGNGTNGHGTKPAVAAEADAAANGKPRLDEDDEFDPRTASAFA